MKGIKKLGRRRINRDVRSKINLIFSKEKDACFIFARTFAGTNEKSKVSFRKSIFTPGIDKGREKISGYLKTNDKASSSKFISFDISFLPLAKRTKRMFDFRFFDRSI